VSRECYSARSSRQLGSRRVRFRECGELAQEAQAANHAIALEIKNAGRTFPPNLATISSQSSTRSNSRDRARFGATIGRAVSASRSSLARRPDLPIRPRVVRAKQSRLLSSCRRAKASSIAPGEKARPLSADSLTSRCDFFTRAGRSLLSCSRPAGRTERALASAHRDGRRSCGGSTGACGSCGLVALAATAEQAPRGGRVNRSPLVLVCPSLRSVRWSELLSSAARWRHV